MLIKELKYIISLVLVLCTIVIPGDCKTLKGGVSKSHEMGMVGLTRGFRNQVVRVIRYSPAWLNDVMPGDIIVQVDGNKGKSCRGTPGSYTIVVFKRKERTLTKSIQRSPESQITKLSRKYGYIKL